jgi:iron complex transport system ATP-binding protein
MTTLNASGLSLSLQGRAILRGVDVSFARGRVSVILGSNGAGKSSLLSCLAGLRRGDAGQVRLGDTDVLAMDRQARARSIGLLPQRADIHWDVDVRTVVELGRMPHAQGWGLSAADYAIVDAAMAATDVQHLAHRSAQKLSGGEQGRVLLARVLAGKPDWLLADEPLASLDPAHQMDVLDRLAQVARDGAGVVLVMHDLSLAARIADDIILMKDGAVLASGASKSVMTADNMAQAYGVAVHIVDDPQAGRMLIPTGRV